VRELLFRGKRISDGEWVFGYYFKHLVESNCLEENKYQHLILNNGLCDWGMQAPINKYEIDPETLGQYTGINLSKAMLFEGDIFRCCDGIEPYGYLKIINISDCEDAFYFGVEVVGNIWDNPELLKEVD